MRKLMMLFPSLFSNPLISYCKSYFTFLLVPVITVIIYVLILYQLVGNWWSEQQEDLNIFLGYDNSGGYSDNDCSISRQAQESE